VASNTFEARADGVNTNNLARTPYDSIWFAAVALLYVLTGACWIPVVFIQYRVRDLAGAATTYDALPPVFHQLMRRWIALGIPAFTTVMIIAVLMVTSLGVATHVQFTSCCSASPARAASIAVRAR